jgi:hypothetical protein
LRQLLAVYLPFTGLWIAGNRQMIRQNQRPEKTGLIVMRWK